ncbi:DMT family transporter [uncultured Roseobacter sp.]|uniref:DMT family transporter n=1 Tax=uncultured Roseobacter sp. TaxID=114847 RepID=UPI00263694A9|nr:DMT family transporter [uncultured Roseobacter sp.]
MTPSIATDSKANLVGSLWMVLAMAAFAVEDVFIKAASQTLPVSQILILFGLGGAIVFAGLAVLNRESLFTPDVVSRPMRLRVFFEIAGRLFFVLAITLTPLSSATVILQATPLVVVAGAALVFDEKVGPRRWVAIFIGLLGVIVIVRPGSESFSLLSLLAVLGMLGFAGRDLASRAAPASLSASILGLYGFLSVVVAGVLFAFWEAVPFVRPDPVASACLLGAVLAGVAAYASLMKAMRTGEVSAVTPFRYTRLLFGIGFGVVLFGEDIGWSVLLGCGLIVLSGLFILWRSKQTTGQA